MDRCTTFLRVMVLSGVALTLLACARGQEFTAPEQQGAVNTGTYPRFAVKPKAATDQFTDDERQKLTEKLDREAHSLKTIAKAPVQSGSAAAAAKEDARREAEETLRQIEQSGK